MLAAEPVIQISAIQHHAYCPRKCALIHVDGIWTDNEHTMRGQRGHRRVDSGAHRQERGRRVLRSIPLWSEALGLTGRADVVEIGPDGAVMPVEYKMGSRQGDAADLQLCAEALCLEEMLGIAVPVGYIWFSAHRRKVAVDIDGQLRQSTLDVIAEIRASFRRPVLPSAVNDERCGECQLLGHCLPGVVAHPESVDRYLAEEVPGCGC